MVQFYGEYCIMHTYYYAEFYLHATRERFAMHTQRKTKFISVIIAVLVTAIACIVGFALTMSSPHFDDRNRGDISSSRSDPAAPDPRREYTDISVDNVDGLVVYKGFTTAGDIKNDITVYGSYNGRRITLSDEEYMISIDDEIIADDARISEVIFEGTQSINFSVTTGTRNAAFPRALDVTGVPTFDSTATWSIALSSGITQIENTHTLQSLKKLFVVSYKVGEVTTVLANKELYDFTVSGDIATASSLTATAKIKDSALSISTEQPVTVKKVGSSDITGIAIAVKDTVELKDGTWVSKDKEDKSHAFVLGASKGRALRSLDIFVEYGQTQKKATISDINASTGEGTISGIDGITSCIITNSDFSGANFQTVNINVRNWNSVVNSGSISLTFETRRIISISAEHVSGTYSSDMAAEASHFTLSGKYNDDENANISGDNVTIFPDSYAPMAKDIDSTTYSKDFTITLNSDSNISCTVTAENIKYIPPKSILNFGIDNGNQEIMKPFDFTNAYANVQFDNDGWVMTQKVYLRDYFEAGKVTINNYYENRTVLTGAVDASGRLNDMRINGISVTATIGGVTSQGIIQGIRVNPAVISVPKISTTPITYSEGCYKQIRGIDFSKLSIGSVDLSSLTIKVTKDSTAGSLNIVYTKGDDGSVTVSKSTVGAASFPADLDTATGRLTFKSGGKFHVSLQLTENGNFRWEQYEPSNTHWSSYDYIYDLEIGKANIEARLEDTDSTPKEIKLTYGDLNKNDGTFTLNGKSWDEYVKYRVEGSSVDIDNQTNRPNFKLYFYGFDGKVFSDNIADLASACKTDVNSASTPYYAVVYARENDAYNATKLYESNAVRIIVEPKELTVNIDDKSIITDKDYSRTEYKLEDFVKVPDEVKNKFWEYADGDALLKIESASLPATSDKPAANVKPEEGYIHADTYGVRLTLTSNNYVWKDESGKTDDDDKYSYLDERFQIKKIAFSFEAEAADFIYGDTEKAGPKYDYSENRYHYSNRKMFDSNEGEITDESIFAFYPVIADAAYYKAADFNTSTNRPSGSAKPLDVTKADEWDAGDYYIYFATSYKEVPKSDTDPTVDLTQSDTKADFDLPRASKKFTVSPREVERVTIADQTKSSDYPANITYKGKDIEFELENYNADIMKFGTYDAETKTFTDKAFIGVTSDDAKPINITDAELTEKSETTEGSAEAVKKYYIRVKHAANYTVWIAFQNPNNYKWKPMPPTEGEGDGEEGGNEGDGGESGDDTPTTPEVSPHDPIDLGFTVFCRTIEWSTEKENDNYQYQYLGDGTSHEVPSFVAEEGSVTAYDNLAIKYKAYTKNDFDPSALVSNVANCGVGTYYFKFYFELGDGTGAKVTDYIFGGDMPTQFVVLAAELLKPTLKADAENTYKGADFAATDFLTPDKDNTSFAGLDIFVINSSGVKSVIRNVGKYTIHVKPKDNYSWGSVTEDKKQEEITFDIEIQQAAVTIDWSDSTLEFTYDGKSHTTVAGVTDVFSPDGVLDDVKVIIRVGETEDSATDDGVTDAGKYIAFAYTLDGAAADNYKIDKTKTEVDDAEVYNYKRDFVIKKQAIVKPTAMKEFTFGDYQDGVELDRGTTDADKDWAWLFNTANTYPGVTASIDALDSADQAFTAHGAKFATGTFTYENAGKYTITLTIGDTKNYCWENAENSDDDNVTETGIVVTIAKKALAAPQATETVTFDETNKKIQLTAGAGTTWASLAARGTYDPDIGGVVEGKDFFNERLSTAYVEFSESKGTFQYDDAGVYILTVTIYKPNNFYWGTDETVKETTITVTVNRKEISSPTIAEPYTVDWTGSAVCPNLATQPGIDSDKYNVVYGSVVVSGEGDVKTFAYNGNYSTYQSTDRGEYFIKFTLKNDLDGFNYKNYIWTAPYGKGSEDRGEYVQRKSHLEITATETTVYLHYAITNALLQVGFKFKDYTFGDNLTEGVLGTLLSAVDDASTESNEVDTFKSEMQNKNVQITVNFVGTNSNNNGSFIWNKFDAGSGTSASFTDPALPWNSGSFFDVSDNLVNYLPWNADTYTVTILLRYSAASTYQDRDVTTTFEIKPFAISVNWSKDSDTISYDGSEHGPTATIDETKVPTLNVDGESTAAGLSLVVGTDVNGTTYAKVKNARDTAYTFEVTAITGTSANGNLASNFDFSKANSATLTINKREVTIKAATDTSVYGDSLQSKNNWTVDTTDAKLDIIADDDTALRNGITYKLVNTDGSAVTLSTHGYYNAGTYHIVLNVPSSGGVFDNYAITVDTATVEYSVTARPITVTIDNDKTTKKYGVALADTNFITVSGNAAKDNPSDIYSYTIKKGEEALDRYSSIGDYAIAITATGNYSITSTTGEAKYVVTPATLTVSVNLVKYYGETVPDNFKKSNTYLYEAKSENGRNTGIYTIEGFARDDDKNAFYAQSNADLFSGSFNYMVNNDNAITFTPVDLAWGNYVFEGGNGNLSVEKLPIKITIAKKTVVYYSAESALPKLNEENDGFKYTVDCGSSFGKESIVLESEFTVKFGDLFTLSSEAVDIVNGYNAKAVGEYDITINRKDSNDFAVKFVIVEGTEDSPTETEISGNFVADYYIITNATITIGNPYVDTNASFDQQDITPHYGVNINASSVDGSNIKIYYSTENIDKADWLDKIANNDANLVDKMPSFYDAGTYIVYYIVVAANHEAVLSQFEFGITQSQNIFEGSFTYGNTGTVKQISTTDNITDNFTEANLGSVVWTYGETVADNPPAMSVPRTKYQVKPGVSHSDLEDFKVSLYYYANAESARKAIFENRSLIYGTDALGSECQAALIALLKSVAKYEAGYYHIVFEMGENNNFTAVTDNLIFRVAKKELTVTPVNGETNAAEFDVTYGDAFAQTAEASIEGFVFGENAATLGLTFVWNNDYEQGDSAAIETRKVHIDNTSKYSHQNYSFKFQEAPIEINKRNVTITIADQWVYYNLYSYGESTGIGEIRVDKAFSITDGSFYNSDEPITLFTDAYSTDTGYKTNNVGRYSIYAKFNGTFGNDYEIHFANCSFSGQLPADAVTSSTGNCAGTFEIKVSTILAYITASDREYNGKAYEAQLAGFDSNDKVKDLVNSFKAVYYNANNNVADGDALAAAPVNAGNYYVEFVYDPENTDEANNYKILTVGASFNITKIKLTVRVNTFDSTSFDKANNMWIVYGSPKPTSNDAIDNVFSGLKYSLYYNKKDNTQTLLTTDDITKIEGFEGNKWDSSTLAFGMEYTPDTSAESLLTVNITKDITATNFEFASQSGLIKVLKREITVTINGVDQLATDDKKLAQGQYKASQNDQSIHLSEFNTNVGSNLNLAKFFKPESGWNGSSDDVLSDLGLSFAYLDNHQGETLDVGKYALKGQYNNNNYIVTFATPSGAGADGKVYYEVTPAQLTVKTVVTDSVTGKKSEVIYGNGIIVTYEPNGYLNGQNFKDLKDANKAGGGVVYDSNIYAQWTTGVGRYDVIHSSDPNNELWFKNYSVSFEKCTFTVVKREITVDDIKSVIYDEEADKTYNGGAKGKAQHAVVNFTDTAASQVIKGVSGDTENATYNSTYGLPARGVGYTISYVYSGNASETYANGAAPDKAGTYNVTITLTSVCKNYKFATASIAKTYTIDKKAVNLAWNDGSVALDGTSVNERKRFVSNFIPDIMAATRFYRFTTSDVQEDTIESVDLGSYDPDGSTYKFYTWDESNEQLIFTAYSEGYYTVTITLNTEARRNYYIAEREGDRNVYETALRLVATSTQITFNELHMTVNHWIYGEQASKLVIDTTAGNNRFAISYAKFDRGNSTWDQVWAGFGDTSKYFANSGFDSVDGLKISNFTSQMPSDVGVYVLSAYYSATGQSRYCLFRITPDTVEAPTINGGSVRDYTYTGSTLVFDVTRYNNQMTVDTGSHVAAPITGGIRVGATNVGSYPITVSISTENYVFATDCGVWTRNDDSTLSYVWQITQAQEEISIEDISRDYDGGNTYADPVTSTKFGGAITIHYAEKVDDTDDSALTGWLTQKPTRVGTFAIRAVVDGTGNYLGDTKYATLVISPVELTVIPYGSMVYGETFDQSGTSAYGVRYSGSVGNDSEDNVTFTGRVTYGIDSDGATGLLDAKTYSMSVDVSGYKTANYTIVGGTGEFVVTPKKITVEIIGSSSTYGDTVDASSLVSRYRVIGYEIAPELLGITPALVGVDDYAHLDARSYSVVADNYTNGNFDITFTPGTYTVDPLRITIGAIDVRNGEVDVITAPSITSWIWHGENSEVGNLTAAQVAELVYGFVYTDSASGEEVTFDELRATVGSYYVLVTQSNPNYRLTGQTTYSFRVLARTVDGTQITIADLAFNNSVQVPVIDFGDYNPSLFEVTYSGDRTNVGTHYVILSLGDNPNYSWSESTSREYRIPFEIVRGDNELVSLDINGWVFGEYKAAENSPVAVTRFGSSNEHIFNYYTKNGDAYERLTGVPVNAGTYYVTVTVPLAPNYNAFTSDYVSFEIAKAIHAVPTLDIITEGEGKNDTYTGEALPAVVLGFDSTEMSIHYDGISNINGNVLTVYATDANTYTIRLALKNDGNYRWAESAAIDDDGYAVLTWTIAKKKIAVPTDNTGRFVVNGSMLTYIPDGFDESIMNISGNTTSYGGTFRVTVTLKDPSNYEWIVAEDGVVRNAYDFTWNVVGADTVFSIVMGILGGLFGAAAVAVLVQFIIHKKRIGGHNAEAAATAAGNGNAAETAATTTETTADPGQEGEGE